MLKNEYSSLELISARLNLPEGYLKELVEEGRIPYLAVGKRKRFQLNTVRTALDKIEKQSIRESRKHTILGGR